MVQRIDSRAAESLRDDAVSLMSYHMSYLRDLPEKQDVCSSMITYYAISLVSNQVL